MKTYSCQMVSLWNTIMYHNETLQPILPHLPPQCRAGNTEAAGRPRGVPRVVPEDSADVLRLELDEGHRFRVGECGAPIEEGHGCLAKRGGEIEGGDLAVLRQRDRPLDGVLQLAHAAGIVVAHEV